MSAPTIGYLRNAREALYGDARNAQRWGQSVAEWEDSLDGVLSDAVSAVGEREMRAIECMVWGIDRKAVSR